MERRGEEVITCHWSRLKWSINYHDNEESGQRDKEGFEGGEEELKLWKEERKKWIIERKSE
jgi:hypothetical protein